MSLRRRAAVVAVIGAAALAAPVAALATTGTMTDKRTVATVTNKGVTWKPALKKLKLATGVTLRVTIVNRSSGARWFQIVTKRTRAVKRGRSRSFLFELTKPGKHTWRIGPGHAHSSAFNGSFQVRFPASFH